MPLDFLQIVEILYKVVFHFATWEIKCNIEIATQGIHTSNIEKDKIEAFNLYMKKES